MKTTSLTKVLLLLALMVAGAGCAHFNMTGLVGGTTPPTTAPGSSIPLGKGKFECRFQAGSTQCATGYLLYLIGSNPVGTPIPVGNGTELLKTAPSQYGIRFYKTDPTGNYTVPPDRTDIYIKNQQKTVLEVFYTQGGTPKPQAK